MARTRRRKGGRTPIGREPFAAGLMEFGEQVWLAGLGAVADARKRGPRLLDELVTEGLRLQAMARSAATTPAQRALEQVQGAVGRRLGSARVRAGQTWSELEKLLQLRVHQAMSQLGVPTTDEIAGLYKSVARQVAVKIAQRAKDFSAKFPTITVSKTT